MHFYAFPRYALEALGMVAIFLGGLLVLQRGSGSDVIPILGALALGDNVCCLLCNKFIAVWHR